jgi:protein arginine kinase
MRLADLPQRGGEWLRGAGPMDDVVISSRVRLARNLAGMPFLSRCSPGQQNEIQQRLRDDILATDLGEEVLYVDVAAAGELDRKLLVERHLISRQHAEAKHPRGVAVVASERVAIMVNEEDHLRMQVLRSGLQLGEAVDAINHLDDALEAKLDFAFHSKYGYLTACPTNVGTGLRISVMLHLPALKMTGEIEKVFRAANDLHLAIRGLYGEGTEATGDFFQISNQTTLGKTAEQIRQQFAEQIIPHVIEYERQARRELMENRRPALEDKDHRAVALLRSARVLSSDEAMYLLSLARLGIRLELIGTPDLRTINELFLWGQPAHLQKILNRPMPPRDRAEARAQFFRQKLGAGAE